MIQTTKLIVALPSGSKWRNDFVLEVNPGTHKRRYISGYTTLTAARKDAKALVREGSANEVSIHRYAANIDRWSVTPYVVEIIEE